MTKRKFSTVALDAARYSLGLLEAPTQTEGSVVVGLRVFRAGTFKDSRGRQNTWTRQQLKDMETNFELLRSNGILPNVPVREDHTDTIDKVIGWFRKVYVDPANPDFLLADIELTEPDKLAKYQRGTYRSRSIEIAKYEDNDGNEYAPVVIGLAFVDLPAVEGLFRLSSNDNPDPAQGDPSPSSGSGASNTKEKKKMAKFKLNGSTETEDEAQVQAHIAALEAFRASAEPVLSHKFKINGVETNDFSAVQAHCLALETFRTETISSGRTAFVDQLAKDGKIGNPMVESFKNLVGTMNDDQFAAFKKTYEAAPKLPLLGGNVDSGGGDSGDGKTELQKEIETLEEIVQQHRFAGKSQDDIEKLPSFHKLTALKAKA